MFRRNYLPILLCTLALFTPAKLLAQTAPVTNENASLARDPAAPGAYTFSWWGRAGRTYFLQQSDDLNTWSYLPVIEPGAGQAIQWGFTSSAPKFFLRLHPTDIPTTDPFNDDFDGDGVSNWDEVMQGTDPFSAADTDHNGLPDDWEKHFFGHIGVDPNEDFDGDGLTNLQEYQLHVDPTDFSNTNAGPLADSDHNGLADWWEMLHFGHIGNDPNQLVPGKGGLTLLQVFTNGLDLVASSTVGDGIPDAWKIRYGISVSNPNVMNEDPDGDGSTNADEYEAGTNPMNWDTDGDYIADGADLSPLVANPSDAGNVHVAVPSWDAQQQLPNPDYTLVDYTAIEVRWEASTYGGVPTGYRVEKRVDSNPWTEMATVGAGTTNQADQGLVANRHYQYRVTALRDANGHAEADGVQVSYQVPLGLQMDVKRSSLGQWKEGWTEFTNPSTPPKYYLTKTDTSSLDGHDSGSGTNSSWSSTRTGQSSYVQNLAPGQHLRTEGGSYTYAYQYNGSDSGGSYASSDNDSRSHHWSDQRRGKGRLTAVAQGDANSSSSSSSSGPSGGSGSSSDWNGTYLLNEKYQPNTPPPMWMGTDFDLYKGTLVYSGNSTYGAHSSGSGGYSSSTDASSTPDSAGNWTGTSTYHWSDNSGSGGSTTPLTSPAWSGYWWSYYWYYGWYDTLTQTTQTQRTYQGRSSSGNYQSNTDATEVISQEYTTAAFTQDVINDLPDYPLEWDKNYYGWGYYGWGYSGWEGWGYWGTWYPYGYPWYGWWIGERHLSKNEDHFSLSKLKYKFRANPSAPTTIKWYEVFVPDDDPATTDVDESQKIEIVAERSWRLGPDQNESPEYEINPSNTLKNGYYTIMIAPAHLATPELGDAGKDVTGKDDEPGKVVLINDGDADGDQVPDYADGYKLHPGVESEEHSYSSTFTPVWVNWTVTDPQHGKIKFTYDGSNPKGITRTPTNLYELPGTGKLRLWTKDGWQDRNGAGIKQGGDYIEPGVEYTLQDFGFDPNYYYYYAGGMTVYVEAVKTSSAVADLPVKVEVDPTGSLGYRWTDQLRFTTTKIELRGKQYSEQEFSPVNRLINSTLNQFDPTVQTYETTPASYEVHRVRLYDPRTTIINRIKIGPVYIPVTRNGSYLETGDFVCVRPGSTVTGWQGSATLVPLAGNTFRIEYNPFSIVDWVCGFFRSSDQSKYMQEVVDKITKDLHNDQSWIANYAAGDRGKFGTETDKRLAAFFRNKPGWYTNVYVNKSTGQILSTGVHLDFSELPPNPLLQDVMEIDTLYTKGGYKITTGPRAYSQGKTLQRLNKGSLLFASEVKTAARLSQTAIDEIIADYKLVTGLEKIYLADSAYAYKLGSNSVVLNTIRARAGRLMGLAGGAFIISASTLNAATNVSEANAKLDETIQIVRRNRAIFLSPQSTVDESTLAKLEAGEAIIEWMRLVIPNDAALGLASLPVVKWIFEDTPTNSMWNYDSNFDDEYDDRSCNGD